MSLTRIKIAFVVLALAGLAAACDEPRHLMNETGRSSTAPATTRHMYWCPVW